MVDTVDKVRSKVQLQNIHLNGKLPAQVPAIILLVDLFSQLNKTYTTCPCDEP